MEDTESLQIDEIRYTSDRCLSLCKVIHRLCHRKRALTAFQRILQTLTSDLLSKESPLQGGLGTAGGNLLDCLNCVEKYMQRLERRGKRTQTFKLSVPFDVIELRSLTCQLHYHACCLLAQDPNSDDGPPHQLQTQQQLQSLQLHGTLIDLQSRSVAISHVAASKGPHQQQLVADLTEAMIEVCDEVEDRLQACSMPPQLHRAASSSTASVPSAAAMELHHSSSASSTDLLQHATAQATGSAGPSQATVLGSSRSTAQTGRDDGRASAGEKERCKAEADVMAKRPPSASAPSKLCSRTEVAEPLLLFEGTQAASSFDARKWRRFSWCTKQIQWGVGLTSIAVAMLLLGWALARSCIARSQYWHSVGLETAADSFKPTVAFVRSLKVHHCPLDDSPRQKCWPFGRTQPAQKSWLEGDYMYFWNDAPHLSDRLSSASVRGHLSQYDHLRHSLEMVAPITAWVDPNNASLAVLDRTHHIDIQQVDSWENESRLCDVSIAVGEALAYVAIATTAAGATIAALVVAVRCAVGC